MLKMGFKQMIEKRMVMVRKENLAYLNKPETNTKGPAKGVTYDHDGKPL
jgi:hypothetical protein